MGDRSTWVIISRDTDSSSSKASTSTQGHSAATTRNTTTTHAGSTTTKVMDGSEITNTTTNKGDVIETKAISGDGTGSIGGTTNMTSTASGTKEGEGIVIKFSIPIQQKNPVTLAVAP